MIRRSEVRELLEEASLPPATVEEMLLAMEARGQQWDPEEPEVEVLWESPGGRVIFDGNRFLWRSGIGWHPFNAEYPFRAISDELARRILAERRESEADQEARERGGVTYRERAEQLEQQLEAQKQVEECLRTEIRSLKAEPAGRLVSHETSAVWERALTTTIDFLASIEGSSHRGYYSTGWAGQRLCALRDWLRTAP